MIATRGVLDAQSSLVSMDELTVLAQQFENEEYIADLIERNLFIEEAKTPRTVVGLNSPRIHPF